MSEARYLVGDVFDRMAKLPDGSVDLIVTSPPFLALRSYLPADHPDKALEIGSEATPAAFLSTLLALTREWRRLLAPHGSLCVELGDTYSGSGGAGGDYGPGGLREGQERFDGSASKAYGTGAAPRPQRKRSRHPESYGRRNRPADVEAGILPPQSRPGPSDRDRIAGWPLAKSLCLLPTLYPASLAYGRNLLNPDDTIDPWRIRNLIVWHRPNPPVGALGDKVRPSTSYITTACVSDKRWFDLDAERGPASPNTHARLAKGVTSRPNDCKTSPDGNRDTLAIIEGDGGAPPLDCWTIPTQPYTGSHYATFPQELPRRLINLMCPREVCRTCGEPRRRITEDNPDLAEAKRRVGDKWQSGGLETGLKRPKGADRIDVSGHKLTLGWTDCGHNTWRRGHVLDPFAGSGTTLAVATGLGRDATGIDIDTRNLELARQRIGMFLLDEEVTA